MVTMDLIQQVASLHKKLREDDGLEVTVGQDGLDLYVYCVNRTEMKRVPRRFNGFKVRVVYTGKVRPAKTR